MLIIFTNEYLFAPISSVKYTIESALLYLFDNLQKKTIDAVKSSELLPASDGCNQTARNW